MDTRDLLNLRRMVLSGATRKPAISAFLDADARTGPAPQQTVQQTPGSVVENARQRALMALGASQKPSMGIPQARLITPTTASSGLGSMLPGRGTPGSAALGAFGQTMSQLGGWQDKPMTFGQILGASLGKAREAYGTAQERESAIAEKKAAAERQAELDELSRRNIESQIEARNKPSTSTAKAIPWKQQTVKDPETGELGKADVAFLPINSPLIAALGGDPTTGRVVRKGSFISETKKGVGVEPIEGVFLENNELSKKRIYRKTTAEGSTVTVVEDPDAKGGFRPINPESEEFISSDNLDGERLKLGDVKKLADETRTQSRGVKTLGKLYRDLDAVEGGFAGLGTSLSAKAKTLFGKDLSPKEMARQLAIGMQQGILGQVRVDVLGPGVMTEQDAERLITYLGGDLRNLTTDPDTVKAAIGKVLRDKSNDYNTDLPFYQRQRALSTSASKLPNFKTVEIPEVRDPASEVLDGPDAPSGDVDALIDRYAVGQYQ